jgi:hypothetical protein
MHDAFLLPVYLSDNLIIILQRGQFLFQNLIRRFGIFGVPRILGRRPGPVVFPDNRVNFFMSSPPTYNNIRSMDGISIGVGEIKINGEIGMEGRRR